MTDTGAEEAAAAIAGWYLEAKAEVLRLLKEREELLDLLKDLWGTWEPSTARTRELELNDRLETLLTKEGRL